MTMLSSLYKKYKKTLHHLNPYGLDMMKIVLKGRYFTIKEFDGLENVYYDEDKILKLVDKDKFLKYMVKSKYRNKPKAKDLKDMFDTYISGDKDMEKNIGKYDEKNERNVK